MLKNLRAIAEAFACEAERYVRWLDRVVNGEVSLVNMRKLHETVGRLQVAAARLPTVAEDQEANQEIKYNRASADDIRLRLPVDAYSTVFDPLEYDPGEMNTPKPVMATISDDLADIYGDLREGLALYEAGRIADALRWWQVAYYSHWGRHLSHAQSPIWQYLSERRRDSEEI